MKIRYLSDLHLEFIKPNKIDKFIKQISSGSNDEICVLAGDIGNPFQPNYDIFIKYINEHFKKTFYIPGNHEYYNKRKTMEETNAHLKEYFKQFTNVSLLHNECEIYENHCFIGSTLWCKITNPCYTINDVHCIPNFDHIECNKLNNESVSFITQSLEHNENCIVISHHMPSSELIDSKYKTSRIMPYNQCFYCDMDDIIKNNAHKISCWIYGHTHTPSVTTLHNVLFACNPIGYPNENKISDFNKQIQL